MSPTDEEQTRARVRQLERQLAELQARWPAHSVPAAMMAELDELEEKLAQARRALARGDGPADDKDKGD